MIRMRAFVLLLFLAGTAWSQEPLKIRIPEGPKPWTSLELNNDPENFQFAIVSDRTGGRRPGIFLEGVKRLNLLQPEFVMSVGDLIDGYTRDTEELTRQWNEFDQLVGQLQMPFFYVPGNHDITNEVMDSVWRARLGPTNYFFVYRDVLFLCLNSEDQYRGAGRGSISTDQYEWIKGVLEAHRDVRWTLAFMHQPLWAQDTDPVRWNDVEALLADRPHTVFVGHRHRYVKFERAHRNNYFMLATTGGGSSLRGPEVGEFDHVVWVTMTDEGPVLANLQLEGIWDENVSTEATEVAKNRILSSQPLAITPIYYGKKGFNKGTATLRITNNEDVPMQISLRHKFNWNYRIDLSENELEVAPNSVVFAELLLEQKRAGKEQPVELIADVKYLDPALPQISLPLTYLVMPEAELPLSKAGRGIQIDGNLEEWKDLPHQVNTTGKTIDDVSARFQTAYDDEYVYIAVDVTDDQVWIDTAEIAYQQDYIGIILNADPINISSMRTGEGWYTNSFYFNVTPSANGLPSSFYGAENLPEGTLIECRKTAKGYQLETAIPIRYLQQQQGQNWRHARIQVVVQDRDEGERQQPRFYFRPDWRGAENRVGSGMFFRK